MNNLEISSLQCFVALAEYGSFTQAAAKINITQSAISQQIAKLEKQLKTQLFHRARSNSLTHAGEILLSYAKEILRLEQEAIDYFKEPELEGEIRFGLPEDFATVFLDKVLSDFSFSHPRISVSVECDLTLNLLNNFKKKHFDLVLVKLESKSDFPNGVEVWREKLVWVAAHNYNPSNNHAPKNIENTNKETYSSLPLVLSPQPCVYRARAIDALNKAGLNWKIVYSSPSFAGATAAVRAGMGITVLPLNMIPPNLDIYRDPKLPDLEDTHISLLCKDNAKKSVKSFADYVLKQLH